MIVPEVKVPQEDGEIVITDASGPTTYKIVDHTTKVTEKQLSLFLAAVEGSEPASKPEANKENE